MLSVSWEEFQADARTLVHQMRHYVNRDFKAVYGIPRGGLVLATYLSHTLNLPLLMPGVPPGPAVLVVDDNVVTGESIAPYRDRGCWTAALIVNPLTQTMPHFHVRVSTDWPIFPWEADSCVEVSR